MTDKKDDDYFVYFKGAKLNKKQARQVGLALVISCIFVAFFAGISANSQNPVIGKIIVAVAVVCSFFVAGKILKK